MTQQKIKRTVRDLSPVQAISNMDLHIYHTTFSLSKAHAIVLQCVHSFSEIFIAFVKGTVAPVCVWLQMVPVQLGEAKI
jgi:hypothetical protein